MSLATIRERVRLELQDQAKTFQAQTVSDGVSTLLDLPVTVIEPEGLSVRVGLNPPLVQGTDYSVNAREGEIQLLIPPAASGTTYTITGDSYRLFPSADLDIFITTALLQHTDGQNPPVVTEEPVPVGSVLLPGVEEYLVAILAVIEALWVLATDLTYDIDIQVPEGVSIPRGQRLRQVYELIAAREAEYLKLSALLNVGLGRLEMLTLRRVSRTTNRFVPLYRAQEWDDRTPPVRLYPPIDKGV